MFDTCTETKWHMHAIFGPVTTGARSLHAGLSRQNILSTHFDTPAWGAIGMDRGGMRTVHTSHSKVPPRRTITKFLSIVPAAQTERLWSFKEFGRSVPACALALQRLKFWTRHKSVVSNTLPGVILPVPILLPATKQQMLCRILIKMRPWK